MSGVLGNANAVLGHVRATIPVLTSATANLSNPAASPRSRFKSAAVLAGIGLIVCILSFAIWQEWQQHIIAATEIQNAQVRKIQAEADAAKSLNEAQVKKLEAEAAVAKQVNEAQAEKLRAEAGAAAVVAEGAKARACADRLDLIAKAATPNDVTADMKIRPGSNMARMMAKYYSECGEVSGATDGRAELTAQNKLDAVACIKGDDPDSQIKGCTGLLEARTGNYGKLTRDLIYFGRASAYREKHEDKKIIEDMNAAILINPANAELYNLRGIAYMILDNEKAIEDFSKAIELDDKDWRPYRNRGLIYRTAKSDSARADADEEKALTLGAPPNPMDSPSKPTPAPTPSYSALATPGPSQATFLRTPTWYDCSKKKRGADYVICRSPELLDAVARLEDAYKTAYAARGDSMKSEHTEWLAHYGPNCGLPAHDAPDESLIDSSKTCVLASINNRIAELNEER